MEIERRGEGKGGEERSRQGMNEQGEEGDDFVLGILNGLCSNSRTS